MESDSLALYEPADIRPGHIVAEFGCGSGYTAVEIAKWIGPGGHVHALDINADFVAQTYRPHAPQTRFCTHKVIELNRWRGMGIAVLA